MRNKIKPSILPGFMELNPKEQLIFNDIVNKITKVYERNGCLPIDTPIIEKEEILLAKSAGETEKQIYSIAREDKKQALRFDLTVPFARYVVQHMNDLVFPFKRYQLGKVYRGERNQKGRYREFYQLDVDIVSINKLDIRNDALVISLAAQAFDSIGLNQYTFQISNRKILSGVLSTLEIDNKQEVMSIIDKYDKIGKDKCLELIEQAIGRENSSYIIKLLGLAGSNLEIIEQLRAFNQRLQEEFNINSGKEELNIGVFELLEGINEIEEVIKTLSILGVSDKNYKIDLKIIRGLDYYTGTIFETVINDNEKYGSICSGGRYDNLAELYTDTKIPGVGISIGITRLFFVLKEIGFLEKYKNSSGVDYLIVALGETLVQCVEINKKLQANRFKTEIYLNGGTLKKQLVYADAQGIPKVIIIGENEINEGVVVVKDMLTGEQCKVCIADI